MGVRAVIGEIDHQRILGETQLIELRQHASHIAVLVFKHRIGAAGVVGVLLFRIHGRLGDEQVPEFSPIALRCRPGRMRGGEGDVAEKRLLPVPHDEIQRLVRADIHDVALRPHHPAVLFQRRIEVLAPVPRGVAEIFREAAPRRVIRVLRAVVPFSEGSRRITRRLERIGEGFLIEVDPLLPGRDPCHAGARVIASGEHLRAGGRAERADVEVLQGRPVRGDRVDVRRRDLPVPRMRVIAPARIVREENDHIRLRGKVTFGKQRKAGQEGRGFRLHPGNPAPSPAPCEGKIPPRKRPYIAWSVPATGRSAPLSAQSKPATNRSVSGSARSVPSNTRSIPAIARSEPGTY